MEIKVVPVVQQGENFDAMMYLNKENIGGVGKDKEGIYLNLKRRLSLHETIEVLKYINGLRLDFFQLEIDIQYVNET